MKYFFFFFTLSLLQVNVLFANKTLQNGDTMYCSNVKNAIVTFPIGYEISKYSTGNIETFFDIVKMSENILSIQSVIDDDLIDLSTLPSFNLFVLFVNGSYVNFTLIVDIDNSKGSYVYDYVPINKVEKEIYVHKDSVLSKDTNADVQEIIKDNEQDYRVFKDEYFKLKNNVRLVEEKGKVFFSVQSIYIHRDKYYMRFSLKNSSNFSYKFGKPVVWLVSVVGGKTNSVVQRKTIPFSDYFYLKDNNPLYPNDEFSFIIVLDKIVMNKTQHLDVFLLEEVSDIKREEANRNIKVSIFDDVLKSAKYLPITFFKSKKKRRYLSKEYSQNYFKRSFYTPYKYGHTFMFIPSYSYYRFAFSEFNFNTFYRFSFNQKGFDFLFLLTPSFYTAGRHYDTYNIKLSTGMAFPLISRNGNVKISPFLNAFGNYRYYSIKVNEISPRDKQFVILYGLEAGMLFEFNKKEKHNYVVLSNVRIDKDLFPSVNIGFGLSF